MPQISQANRPISISTPLGADVLLLQGVEGTESLSGLYRFRLEMLAESSEDIAFDSLLGQEATVTMRLPDGSSRYLSGIVSEVDQGGRLPSPLGPSYFTVYHAELVPKLWLLTRKIGSRIFQQMNVPDILTAVFSGLSIKNQLQGTYKPRDYCVQYRESDFDFAARLMEEEGIYYYFKHASGSHQMVIADTPGGHDDVPGATTVFFEEQEGGLRDEDRVHSWRRRQAIRPGKLTLWDQCFELPGQNLEAVKSAAGTVQGGTVSMSLTAASNDALEVYEFPGGYAKRFDGTAPGGGDRPSDVQNIFEDNERTAGIRIQEQNASAIRNRGTSTCRQFAAGCKFTLDRHFNANGPYVLTRVTHRLTMGDAYTTGGNGQGAYENEFECIPASLAFRPERNVPRRVVEGPQTAVVVGNSGDEIFTDKYGRVKVQFPWDRIGQKDANSSCWVRVGTPWAGQQWGMIHIPRVGQEVIVHFEEGDPDRPIIVGSVYNAANMPPYTLPDNMTQSGYLSRSSLDGTAENFNQLRFEDKKDSEEVYFHAEKDFNRVVENNDTLKVGFDKKDKGDQAIEIYNNQAVKVGTANCDDGSQAIEVYNGQSLKVGTGEAQASSGSQTVEIYKDRSTTLKTGNDTLTISQGNRSATVKQGDDSLEVTQGKRTVSINGDVAEEIKQGNRSVKIDMGNDSLTISMGNQTTKLDLGSSSTEAMQSIELKVGQNSIKIDQTGVTIQGLMIKVQGQVQTQVQGLMVQVSADAMLQAKGGITMIG
ncbi:Phage-related baseplate assembly protein [Aquisphaera giovannonii]|uniref:Phage-related baseplate assembly protein n=1 Tax=Aquisphaera giovannonii TaxID=406548 RepID=A0A5B9VZ24_9BACT|nr:type VI secretion system tip protein VgrG [Aquisphaera giovannonii]QEH33231.1 Phage-related baseplate assembly protein [Aquisphaera giovannonii]